LSEVSGLTFGVSHFRSSDSGN